MILHIKFIIQKILIPQYMKIGAAAKQNSQDGTDIKGFLWDTLFRGDPERVRHGRFYELLWVGNTIRCHQPTQQRDCGYR